MSGLSSPATEWAPLKHMAVRDDAAAHTCAQRDADQVVLALAGAYFPLGVGHAVGIVLDSHGELCAVLQNIPQRNVGPASDVGEVVDNALSRNQQNQARRRRWQQISGWCVLTQILDDIYDGID